MNQRNQIFICEDTPDGIFTAIYDAWAARIPEEYLKIRVEGMDNMQLFTDYVYVQTDLEKAVKVARSVSARICKDAYDMMYLAALSYEEDKIDAIYHFLKLGFPCQRAVMDMLAKAEVSRMIALQRNVANEAHLFRGFLRFCDSENGILISKIKPKNQILPLLAPHFSDRFPGETFVIVDETHEMAVFHERNKAWFLSPLDWDAMAAIRRTEQRGEYEKLWKTFFKTIAIRERKNYQCQRNLCALRYRDYMLEFQ